LNGLELSREFFETEALPDLLRRFPEAAEWAAAGLAGNGSECFGFDDELSRDHDWGIDFFLWIPESKADYLPALRDWKAQVNEQIPPELRKHRSAYGAQVGVQTVGEFYKSLIGCIDRPKKLQEWISAPEENLCMAVNGSVFRDPAGEFTAVRQRILAYFPEDIRLKKMAAACMRIAQSGQYNLPRMAKRQDWVAAQEIRSQFIRHAMHLCFLLEKRYMPYYKWAWRSLCTLPGIGAELGQRLKALVETCGWDQAALDSTQEQVERICALLIRALREQGISTEADDFLIPHGEAIRNRIQADVLRELPTQYDPFP